jgi:hypothetical protein
MWLLFPVEMWLQVYKVCISHTSCCNFFANLHLIIRAAYVVPIFTQCQVPMLHPAQEWRNAMGFLESHQQKQLNHQRKSPT